MRHRNGAVHAAPRPAALPVLEYLRWLAGERPPELRWAHWVLRLDGRGRVSLPAEARRVASDDGLVRVASHGHSLVLRRGDTGTATMVDSRGRLLLPPWLRRVVAGAGLVLVSARRPDAALVVIAPPVMLDGLAEAVAGEVR